MNGNEVIDLTNDSDPEVQVLEELVCVGAIHVQALITCVTPELLARDSLYLPVHFAYVDGTFKLAPRLHGRSFFGFIDKSFAAQFKQWIHPFCRGVGPPKALLQEAHDSQSPQELNGIYCDTAIIRGPDMSPTVMLLAITFFVPIRIATNFQIGLLRNGYQFFLPPHCPRDASSYFGFRLMPPPQQQPPRAPPTIQYQPLKTEDLQREVDDVFKSLTSGVDLPETEPSPMVVTPLYAHQKKALSFILEREKIVTELDRSDRMVGLWQLNQHARNQISWHSLVADIHLPGPAFPPQTRASLLADDMGLGKTIVIISLVTTTLEDAQKFETSELEKDVFDPRLHPDNKKNPTSTSATSKKGQKKEDSVNTRFDQLSKKSRGTLIVCPLSTIQNWEGQFEEHTKGANGDKSPLSIYVYHGNTRTTDPAQLANHDVVITTFSTLSTEYSKQLRAMEVEDDDDILEVVDTNGLVVPSQSAPNSSKETPSDSKKRKKRPRKKEDANYVSPLQAVQWFRVVLDEAHIIKGHTTVQARAACDLSASRRVALSGTPLQNNLDDLFSLLNFLRLEPFTDRARWTMYIGALAKKGHSLAVSRLKLIMRHIALRRTKDTVDASGRKIIDLPPNDQKTVFLNLDSMERAYYASHHTRYKHDFKMLEQSDSVLKNYCSILQELLRLRQICVHVSLCRDSENQPGGDLIEGIKKLGLTKYRALKLLGFCREVGAGQCSECAFEMFPPAQSRGGELDLEQQDKKPAKKKGKKCCSTSASNVGSDEDASFDVKFPKTIAVTKCQHLLCPQCMTKKILPTMTTLAPVTSTWQEMDSSIVNASNLFNYGQPEGEPNFSTENMDHKPTLIRDADEHSYNGLSFTGPQWHENVPETKPVLPQRPSHSPVQLDEKDQLDATQKLESKYRKMSISGFSHRLSPSQPPQELKPAVDSSPKSDEYVVCSVCQLSLQLGVDLIECKVEDIDTANDEEVKTEIEDIEEAPKVVEYSTKTRTLLQDLLPFSRANPDSENFTLNEEEMRTVGFQPVKGENIKSIVFSQWTKLLDKIEGTLNEAKIKFVRLDGTMTRDQRNVSMDTFKNDKSCEVLLISLKAGGVGLNLTAGRRVYLMEPFWNPAVENQAIDRVHRLGQTKPVQTIRYVISQSIEENMLKIQKKKTQLAEMSLGQTLSKSELAKQRIENLRTLLS